MRILLTRGIKYATLSLFLVLNSPAAAQEVKTDVVAESNRAAKLCFDFVVHKKNNLDGLIANGYRVKNKKKIIRYIKGAGYAQWGSGVELTVRKDGRSCEFLSKGIRKVDGDKIFQSMQSSFSSSGFNKTIGRRGRIIYSKGDINFGLKGSSEGTSMKIDLYLKI